MKSLSLKGRVYPTDLNPSGAVFGGWVMGKMDKAASIAVDEIVRSRAVTVSVSNIHLKKPFHSGDIFTIYTDITHIGTSSITIFVDVEVKDFKTNQESQVTSAEFKFVTIDEAGKAIPVSDVLRPCIHDDIKLFFLD
jgi:acyl-CoA thioesterase YciA